MSFIDSQNEFMAHIREPEHNPKPNDIEDRRMAIYRDLFFNNIAGFISSVFHSQLLSEHSYSSII